MADNVTLPGTGDVLGADEVTDGTLGTVKVEYVKIMDGTLNGTSKATVDGSGLRVHVAPAAGTIAKAEDAAFADADVGVPPLAVRTAAPANRSGADGDYEPLQMADGKLWVSPLGFPVTITVSFSRPADTTLYTVDDAMSDSTTAPTSGGFTFTGAGRVSGGSILITDLVATSDNGAPTTGNLEGELWLFETSVANINDNAAFAITDAESDTIVGVIPFSMIDIGNNQVATVTGLNILATCSGSANLRFLIRVKNGYTPASAENFTWRLKGLQLN